MSLTLINKIHTIINTTPGAREFLENLFDSDLISTIMIMNIKEYFNLTLFMAEKVFSVFLDERISRGL